MFHVEHKIYDMATTITCARLGRNLIGADCANPIVGGIRPDIVLMNLDDIDFTSTTIVDGVVTKLILREGKTGYLASTLPNAANAPSTFVKGTYMNRWDHTVELRIFNAGPEVNRFISELGKATLVAVVRSNYVKTNPTAPEVAGETVFRVYGIKSGMVMLEGSVDPNDADTQGGYYVKIGSSETAKEPEPPLPLFSTSLAATEALVESLWETTTPAP